jgi:adenylosuccinate synthase
VHFLEEALGIPVAFIGTGPEAEALIVREDVLPG